MFHGRPGHTMNNILILSVGTRNKVIQYFKETFAGNGSVIAADASSLAPALYEADRAYTVPPLTAPDYIDAVLAICAKERIAGVLSLIDPEGCLLAANEAVFRAAGVTVIGSSAALCETARDKYAMSQWLAAHGYRSMDTWEDAASFEAAAAAGRAAFPAMVKPRFGYASVGCDVADSPEELACLMAHKPGMLIQPYADGAEIGADVYADLISGEVVSVFTKRKIKMRAGETDKSVSIRDPALFALIGRFVAEAGFRGPVDIDLFEIGGQYYISEVNPRFGGGYPHAHACGCDFTKLILNNLKGVANEPRIGDYEEGVYMMKYSDVTIRREAELAKP